MTPQGVITPAGFFRRNLPYPDAAAGMLRILSNSCFNPSVSIPRTWLNQRTPTSSSSGKRQKA